MNNGVSYTSTKPLEEFEINKKNKPSDLISRLSELRSQYSCFEETERDAYHTLSEAIEALKEQKTGKWIGNEFGECSACGHKGCASDIWDRCEKHYCPNCGTLLEEEQ
ncbi:MAG: hypothetical protein IKG39_06130 [Lachnospiraceae bacterium]|nr:hypothetical protein [Lachnospiraceae bacterium]